MTETMLKRAARVIFIVGGIVALLWLLRPVVFFLLRVGLISAILCFILFPLHRRLMHKMPEGRAALISLLAGVFGLLGLLYALVMPAARQLGALVQSLPALIAQWDAFMQRLFENWPAQWSQMLQGEVQTWIKSLIPPSEWMMGLVMNLASWIGFLVPIPVLVFYILKDHKRLFFYFELMVPFAWRKTALRCAQVCGRALRGYVQAQLFLSVSVWALSAVLLWLLGAPGVLVISLMLGVLNLLPIIGPVISGVLIGLLLLPQGAGAMLIGIAGFVLIQWATDSLLMPRIMGAVSGHHPALILLSVLCGGVLLGGVGLFLAMPAVLVFSSCFQVIAASRVKSMED